MKTELPLIVIIASALVILANFIVSEDFDFGFWMTTLSSLLIIIAMVLTIKAHKKQDKN